MRLGSSLNIKMVSVGLALGAFAFGCDDGGAKSSGSGVTVDENAANPFLESAATPGKSDTQYFNPDGVEVEVDLEADIDAPDYKKDDAPAILGQFAMTYMRENKSIYLESLAEQGSSSDRVEWLIDGAWKTAREASSLEKSKLTHFRIRGVNAVLLNSARTGVDVGKVFEAPVPVKPFSVFADAGVTCGEEGGHIDLSQTYYWYLWNPNESGCKAKTQKMKITVSKMLPSKVTYPEYDKLVADGKVTMVVLFGLIDDELSKTETGYRAFAQMGKWLVQGGFTKAATAPVGERYSKTVKGTVVEVDLYSPYDFSGLSDSAHFGNFQKALSEHEIVTYDGHSMLGASDFWERPDYPESYQIFLYGGCLGYEYYIAPILAGKGGWDNLDMLSAVVEVSANANEYAGPFLAKLLYALDNGYKVSWKDILGAIRTRVGDSTFGMSGVRDNCFSPGGSLCGGTTPTPGGNTWTSTPNAAIPDNAAAGVTSTIDVSTVGTIKSLSVKVTIDHSYIGDLVVTLEKDGVSAKLYEGSGVGGSGLDETFTVTAFKGKALKGAWKLVVVDNAAEDVGTLQSWSIAAELQ